MNPLEIAVFCLALNVYHESRGEPIEGQYAVAQATMNRAGYNRKKVCEVVIAPAQFSWTINGVWWLKGKPHLNPNYRPKNGPENGHAWKMAVQVARASFIFGKVDVVGDATFFHTVDVWPHWAPHVEYVKTIGAHRFYRGDGKYRPENLIKVVHSLYVERPAVSHMVNYDDRGIE